MDRGRQVQTDPGRTDGEVLPPNRPGRWRWASRGQQESGGRGAAACVVCRGFRCVKGPRFFLISAWAALCADMVLGSDQERNGSRVLLSWPWPLLPLVVHSPSVFLKRAESEFPPTPSASQLRPSFAQWNTMRILRVLSEVRSPGPQLCTGLCRASANSSSPPPFGTGSCFAVLYFALTRAAAVGFGVTATRSNMPASSACRSAGPWGSLPRKRSFRLGYCSTVADG
ncbi:hypothetical protein MTO96_018031 [Rhipicephalus appendiculatus]